MTYRPKHIAEYIALRGVAALFICLPHPVSLRLAEALAALCFYVFRFRRTVAETRIRSVFGETYTDRDVRRIAWCSWRNLVLNGVEMLRSSRMTPEDILRRFPVTVGTDAMKSALAQGKGLVVAVPHTGNWELAAVAARHSGVPIFTFGANQKNPLTDRYIKSLREGPGMVSIQRDSGSLREVIRRLKRNEALAMLPDVRMRTPGLCIPFLGGHANIGKGMASFARQTGAPILLVFVRRDGLARLTIEVQTLIWPDTRLDKDEDVERMTREVMQRVDAFVRSEPEQWFWFNKRWILDPL